MTDSRIAGFSYAGLPSTDAAQNLRSLDQGFRSGSGVQIAQTPTTIKAKEVWVNPKNRMTPAQEKNSAKVEKMLKDWAAAKAANPNNLNNILGMNSDKAVGELAAIGVSAEIGDLKELDNIAMLTGYHSPASLGSNWEQKTAFLTKWVRKTTNDVSVATKGIQMATQLYQEKSITANDARIRIAGYTLQAQAASAKLNKMSALLSVAGLKIGTAEGKTALGNLTTRIAANQATVQTALKTADLKLDTIAKVVQNQVSGATNTNDANLTQLDNLRRQTLTKVQAVAPNRRGVTGNASAAQEFDPKTKVALPYIPTRNGDFLSATKTKELITSTLPILNNAVPEEVRPAPTPGAGIGIPQIGKVAATERQAIRTTALDLKRYDKLTTEQFTAKFGGDRGQLQREYNEIKNGIPVKIDTQGLEAPVRKSDITIDNSVDLNNLKKFAAKATGLTPALKTYVAGLNEKTMMQYYYCVGLAELDAGVKTVLSAKDIIGLGKKSANGGKSKFDPGTVIAKMKAFVPSADFTQLNNLYGQKARVGNFEQTLRSYSDTLLGYGIAGKGYNLAKANYGYTVVQVRQNITANKTAVSNVQSGFSNLQTQMSALRTRQANALTNNQGLAVANQSLVSATRINKITVASAQADNKIAAQAGAITDATGQNNTFMASLTNVVNAGIDFNLDPNQFKQAPTVRVMTAKGLVVPQKFLQQAYESVAAAAGSDASKVRYDTPAVLRAAEALTYKDFKASHRDAYNVLFSSNSVSASAVRILRDGKYDVARSAMPVNRNAAPARDITAPSVGTRVVWGDPKVPTWAAFAVRRPQAVPVETEKERSVLHAPGGRSSNTEPTQRRGK